LQGKYDNVSDDIRTVPIVSIKRVSSVSVVTVSSVNTTVVCSVAGKDVAQNVVRIRYQETTSEDIEGFMCAAVTVVFRVCKPVRLL
jgi:hypothetical protein